MDNVNMKNWVSHPEVCRCCLSATGTWDVTASYISESGMKEVYFEMLQECYGLTLSRVMEWGPSRLVCGQCVRHLRDACSFKKQVLLAESLFTDYCANKDNLHTQSVKIEKETIELYNTEPVSFTCNADVINDGENKVKGKPNVNLGKTGKDEIICTKRQRSLIKEKRKRKIIDSDNDIDSDTPIAALTRKNNIESNEIVAKDLGHRTENKTEEIAIQFKRKAKTTAENYVDNRRLRSNITLLLKNSTIVPFKHINNTKYICLYCDANFLFFKELRDHVAKQHSDIKESDFKQCLKTPKDLVKADISVIACKLCGDSLKCIDKLVEHLIEAHRKVYHHTPRFKPSHGLLGFDMRSDNLKCHQCSKEFRFFKNLSVHMNEHSDYFMCHVCGKRFVSEHRLQTHVATHRAVNARCKYCEKDFKSLSARSYHIRKMHINAKFKCTECSETFTQYQHRLRHLVDTHNFKKPAFKCDVCAKHFASSGGLRAHVRYSHLKNKEYSCQTCGKVFVYKWIWKRHLDIHTGAKNFECKLCNKRFAKPYTLRVHMKIHLNDKKFVCPVCKVAFVQKTSLGNHLRVHHPDLSMV
ncbi:zinc finger protein 26 isoform X2 [Manduca sexta]|uniref:zinc finger protein 26 isoform X2 n=1 Tax=Manduca sexta TaxID=7130 RepID=UPI001183C522|nr:zinc finger protein 26 isoform X2 [Manduca sexta]